MIDNKINDFLKLNSNKDRKRINSLLGKEIIIHFYHDKEKNTFTEAIMPLIKFTGNKLFLGENKPKNAVPLIVDLADVKGIAECQNLYKISKEMVGVSVKITNIYNKEIDAVILKDEPTLVVIEFDNNEQTEY